MAVEDIILRVLALGIPGARAQLDQLKRSQDRVVEASEGMAKKTKKHTAATREAFHDLAGAFVGLTMARQAVGALEKVIAPAIDLGSAMADMRAYTIASTEELDKMASTAQTVADKTIFYPKDVFAGMVDLQRAALGVEEATRTIFPAAVIAEAGGMQLSEGVRVVAATFENLSVRGAALNATLDKLAWGARNLGIDFKMLPKFTERFGVAAKYGNQSLEDLLLTYTLVRRGLGSPEAVTRLMTRAIQELREAQSLEHLQLEMGIPIVDAMTGRMRALPLIMRDLARRWGTNTLELQRHMEQAKIGGVAMRLLLAGVLNINDGLRRGTYEFDKYGAGFDRFYQDVQKTGGELDRIATAKFGAAARQWNSFLSSVANTLATAFKAVDPIFATVLKGFVGFFSVLRSGLSDLGPVSTLLRFAATAALLLTGAVVGLGAAMVTYLALGKLSGVVTSNLVKWTAELTATSTAATAATVAETTALNAQATAATKAGFAVRFLGRHWKNFLKGTAVFLLIDLAAGAIAKLFMAEDKMEDLNEGAAQSLDSSKLGILGAAGAMEDAMESGASGLEDMAKALKAEADRIEGANAPLMSGEGLDKAIRMVAAQKGLMAESGVAPDPWLKDAAAMQQRLMQWHAGYEFKKPSGEKYTPAELMKETEVALKALELRLGGFSFTKAGKSVIGDLRKEVEAAKQLLDPAAQEAFKLMMTPEYTTGRLKEVLEWRQYEAGREALKAEERAHPSLGWQPSEAPGAQIGRLLSDPAAALAAARGAPALLSDYWSRARAFAASAPATPEMLSSAASRASWARAYDEALRAVKSEFQGAQQQQWEAYGGVKPGLLTRLAGERGFPSTKDIIFNASTDEVARAIARELANVLTGVTPVVAEGTAEGIGHVANARQSRRGTGRAVEGPR